MASFESYPSLAKNELVSDLNKNTSPLTDFAHSFADAYVYRAVVAPAEAIGQVLHIPGSETLREQTAPANSAQYHGRMFGDAAAMVTHMLLAKKVAGSLFPSSLEANAAANFTTISVPREFAKGAAFGFAYQSLLTPSTKNELESKGLLQSRIENGLAGAAVFGTMNSFAGLLKNAGISAEANGYSNIKAALSNAPLVGALSGVPGGFMAAESDALLKQHRMASFSEVNSSIYGMSMVGLGFGAMSRLTENQQAPSKQSWTDSGTYHGQKLFDSILGKMDSLADHVSNGLDRMGDALLGPRPQLAYAMADGGRYFVPEQRFASEETPQQSMSQPLHMESDHGFLNNIDHGYLDHGSNDYDSPMEPNVSAPRPLNQRPRVTFYEPNILDRPQHPTQHQSTAEAPHSAPEAPAKVAEVPAKVAEVPAKVAEAPAKVAEAPAKVVEAPAKVLEAPVEVAKVAEQSVKIEEAAVPVEQGLTSTSLTSARLNQIIAAPIDPNYSVSDLQSSLRNGIDYSQLDPGSPVSDQIAMNATGLLQHSGTPALNNILMKGEQPGVKVYYEPNRNVYVYPDGSYKVAVPTPSGSALIIKGVSQGVETPNYYTGGGASGNGYMRETYPTALSGTDLTVLTKGDSRYAVHGWMEQHPDVPFEPPAEIVDAVKSIQPVDVPQESVNPHLLTRASNSKGIDGWVIGFDKVSGEAIVSTNEFAGLQADTAPVQTVPDLKGFYSVDVKPYEGENFKILRDPVGHTYMAQPTEGGFALHQVDTLAFPPSEVWWEQKTLAQRLGLSPIVGLRALGGFSTAQGGRIPIQIPDNFQADPSAFKK